MGPYRRVSRSTVRVETQKRRERIQDLHLQGYTIDEISTIVDRSIATVKAALRFMPRPGDEDEN